jgi:acyl-coenzyme A thioesterase PaaI-like protein
MTAAMDDLGTDADLRDATTELGAVMRAALAATVSTAASPDALRTAAAEIRAAIEPLQTHQRPASVLSPLDDMERGVRVFSPVLGEGHGFAVPLRFEQKDDTVLARVTLGQIYEGPPTLLHGGVAALLMDQLLGEGAIIAGRWGMTVGLTLRYRRPVPLHTPLLLTSRMSEGVGRRTTVTGTIATEEAPDTALVEATGIFVSPSPQASAAIFAAVRTASGEPADGRLGLRTTRPDEEPSNR